MAHICIDTKMEQRCRKCVGTQTKHKGSWDAYQPHILESPPIPLNVRRALTLILLHSIDLEIEDKTKRTNSHKLHLQTL